MQSNSDSIPNFAHRSAKRRELTKGKARMDWKKEHQACFQELVKAFQKDILLRYFYMSKTTYVFVDAHIDGIGSHIGSYEFGFWAEKIL